MVKRKSGENHLFITNMAIYKYIVTMHDVLACINMLSSLVNTHFALSSSPTSLLLNDFSFPIYYISVLYCEMRRQQRWLLSIFIHSNNNKNGGKEKLPNDKVCSIISYFLLTLTTINGAIG